MTIKQIFDQLRIDYREIDTEADDAWKYILFCPRGDQGIHKRKRKLYVNPAKGRFHCFQCDGKAQSYKGKIKKLLRDLGADPDLLDEDVTPEGVTLDEIAHRLLNEPQEPKEGKYDVLLPREYSTHFWESTKGQKAFVYLKDRKVADKLILKHKIGYCEEGEFGGYLIIPITEDSKVVYFQGRKFHPTAVGPKYKNPPASESIGKGEIVFGLDFIDLEEPVTITEGVFDALRVPNAVSVFGKTITQKQISKLLRIGVTRVTVMLDNDAREEAATMAKVLASEDFEEVRLAVLPKSFKDPGSAPEEVIERSLNRAKVVDGFGLGLISRLLGGPLALAKRGLQTI